MNACTWRARSVTLYDGTVTTSDSDDWRNECEARAIIAIPTVGQRRDLLETIERRRGKAAADRLKYTIKQIWYAPRGA